MQIAFVNTFIGSSVKVLKEILATTVVHGHPSLVDSVSTKGFSATIFLTGGVEGKVVVALDAPLAMKIAGVMNSTIFEKLDRLAIDSVCELSNIIIGNAVTELNDKGFRFKTSPPCFFVGEKTFSGAETMCVPLSTGIGNMKILLAVKENMRLTAKEQFQKGGEVHV